VHRKRKRKAAELDEEEEEAHETEAHELQPDQAPPAAGPSMPQRTVTRKSAKLASAFASLVDHAPSPVVQHAAQRMMNAAGRPGASPSQRRTGRILVEIFNPSKQKGSSKQDMAAARNLLAQGLAEDPAVARSSAGRKAKEVILTQAATEAVAEKLSGRAAHRLWPCLHRGKLTEKMAGLRELLAPEGPVNPLEFRSTLVASATRIPVLRGHPISPEEVARAQEFWKAAMRTSPNKKGVRSRMEVPPGGGEAVQRKHARLWLMCSIDELYLRYKAQHPVRMHAELTSQCAANG